MRISIFLSGALLVAGLMSACQPIQPEAAAAPQAAAEQSSAASAPAKAPQSPTVFVLPDGATCNFAGMGATMAFDGERLNYDCSKADATSITALLGDPLQEVNRGAGVWTVNLASISHNDDGFKLESSEPLTFFASELDLANGSVCLHAGFGATFGFDDKRLNYTCGAVDGKETGIVGELTYDAIERPGVYVAQQVAFHSAGDAGWAIDSSEMVDVLKIVGAEMPVLPGKP